MPDGFSMARAARAVLLTYYGDFMDSWEPASESRFIPDVVGRFVLFEAYLRERIAEAKPALHELGGVGRLDTLLRRILPEFPAFLGIMDAYHTPAEDRRTNTPLDNPPVTSSWGNVRKIHVPTLDVHVSKVPTTDRKSTRLNSSHGSISYAVFCLQKN